MAAAALLAAFAVGILAGRAAFPREVPVTQVVTRPQVVERVVKVPVPVVRERVVVRNVPMVRTRVVYRDRPVPVTVPAVPVKVEQLVVPVDASAVTFRPVFVRELQPVTVVDRTQPAPESDGNRSGARGDLGEPRFVPAVRLAQWVRDGQ
jgi:hypothetical protein